MIKLPTFRPATSLKRGSNTGVFLCILWNFKNTYFGERLRTAVFESYGFVNVKATQSELATDAYSEPSRLSINPKGCHTIDCCIVYVIRTHSAQTLPKQDERIYETLKTIFFRGYHHNDLHHRTSYAHGHSLSQGHCCNNREGILFSWHCTILCSY